MNRKAEFNWMVLLMSILVMLLIWNIFEGFNSDKIETGKKVPCLDSLNREFETELCYEQVDCTELDYSLYSLLFKYEKCSKIRSQRLFEQLNGNDVLTREQE